MDGLDDLGVVDALEVDRRDAEVAARARAAAPASPGVHADLATPTALSSPDEQRAASLIDIGLGQGERFLRSPARHKITVSPRSRRAVRVVARRPA
jgi:hypothetical protein